MQTTWSIDLAFTERPWTSMTVSGGWLATIVAGLFVYAVLILTLDFPPSGFAASPLIIGNSVVTIPGGGDGNAIVAYDRASGRVAWSALDDEPSYSSPVRVTLAGVEQIQRRKMRHFRQLFEIVGKRHCMSFHRIKANATRRWRGDFHTRVTLT